MFELTEIVTKAVSDSFVEIEPHDHTDGDWENPDRLWLEKTPDSDVCEGEYIDISLASKDGSLWYASHDSADRHGGHPTLWSTIGTESQVEEAVVKYLKTR